MALTWRAAPGHPVGSCSQGGGRWGPRNPEAHRSHKNTASAPELAVEPTCTAKMTITAETAGTVESVAAAWPVIVAEHMGQPGWHPQLSCRLHPGWGSRLAWEPWQRAAQAYPLTQCKTLGWGRGLMGHPARPQRPGDVTRGISQELQKQPGWAVGRKVSSQLGREGQDHSGRLATSLPSWGFVPTHQKGQASSWPSQARLELGFWCHSGVPIPGTPQACAKGHAKGHGSEPGEDVQTIWWCPVAVACHTKPSSLVKMPWEPSAEGRTGRSSGPQESSPGSLQRLIWLRARRAENALPILIDFAQALLSNRTQWMWRCWLN